MHTPVLLNKKCGINSKAMLAFFTTLTVVSIVYFTVQNFPGYSHHVVDHVKGSHHIPFMPQTSER